MNTTRLTFVFDTPLNLEQNNCFLGSTDSDVCNSVFSTKKTKVNSDPIQGFWTDLVTMKRMKNVSAIRISKDLQLYVNEVGKKA